MSELLSKLDSASITILTFLLGLLAVGLIGLVLGIWQHVRLRESDNALKQQLLMKGFAAADIERVISAAVGQGNPVGSAYRKLAPISPIGAGQKTSNQADLVRILMAHDRDAGDIERLLLLLSEYRAVDWPVVIDAVETLLANDMDSEGIERVVRAMHRQPAPLAAAPDYDRGSLGHDERPRV